MILSSFPSATVVPRPLSNDPRFTQCVYRYSRASKRFVEVYNSIDCVKINLQSEFCLSYNIGPRREKTCLREFANNIGADQPAHPHSLISAFVIRFLKSIICKLAAGEILN